MAGFDWNSAAGMLSEVAANTASGIVTSEFNKKNTKELAAYDYQLAEEAAVSSYERQLDFWNKQNEYNTPSNQRTLLEQAGLNPALMYGSSVSSSTASSLSSTATGQGKTTPTNYNLTGSMDIINKMAMATQIKKTNADIDKTNAESEAIRASLPTHGLTQSKLSAEIEKLSLDNKFSSDTLDLRTASSQYDMLDKSLRYQDQQQGYSAKNENDYWSQNVKSNITTMNAQASEAVSSAKNAGFTADMSETRKNMYYAENLGKILQSYGSFSSDVIKTIFGFLPSGILGAVLKGFGEKIPWK